MKFYRLIINIWNVTKTIYTSLVKRSLFSIYYKSQCGIIPPTQIPRTLKKSKNSEYDDKENKRINEIIEKS